MRIDESLSSLESVLHPQSSTPHRHNLRWIIWVNQISTGRSKPIHSIDNDWNVTRIYWIDERLKYDTHWSRSGRAEMLNKRTSYADQAPWRGIDSSMNETDLIWGERHRTEPMTSPTSQRSSLFGRSVSLLTGPVMKHLRNVFQWWNGPAPIRCGTSRICDLHTSFDIESVRIETDRGLVIPATWRWPVQTTGAGKNPKKNLSKKKKSPVRIPKSSQGRWSNYIVAQRVKLSCAG